MKIATRILKACPSRFSLVLLVLAAAVGCTGPLEYIRNGFKVGPNYSPPEAMVSSNWIDADASGNVQVTDDGLIVKSNPVDLACWWHVFQDPVLDSLMDTAYQQNLDVRTAVARVLQAQAERGIAVGNLFPQQQTWNSSYQHLKLSQKQANVFLTQPFFDNWSTSLNSTWEVDIWGRYRRTIESATDALDATVFDYDAVLVTLFSDVATEYVLIRTLQQQIDLLQKNVALQEAYADLTWLKWQGPDANPKDRPNPRFPPKKAPLGQGKESEIPYQQTVAILQQTKAQIPPLQAQLRQAGDRLCTLLGVPPYALVEQLGLGPIPQPPAEVAIGVPADLVRRRPDVRAAERRVAAQSALIGVAESDLYPSFFLNGVIGLQAKDFGRLFDSRAMFASVGPSFQWNLLNYGRILNNVRAQDAAFEALLFQYQQSVLQAGQEVENALAGYLRAHEQSLELGGSVYAYERAFQLTEFRFKEGKDDYTPVLLVQIFMIEQELLKAQAMGNVALSLVSAYRALGGGWQAPLMEGELVGPDGMPLNCGPMGPEGARPGPETAPAPREADKNPGLVQRLPAADPKPRMLPAGPQARPMPRQPVLPRTVPIESEMPILPGVQSRGKAEPPLLPRLVPIPEPETPAKPRRFIVPAAYSGATRN